MYTELKSYQIIIQLLEEYGISKLVLSAGSRNVPFVHSVEEDDFFDCYSVVDERSAGYFALGLAQESGEPVVISCTSSTATCNYWPPVAEAYYQNVPLVVLTSDRDPQMVRNREDQMIDQVGMYDRHVKMSVNLPIVKDDDDYLYCVRLVNEALLELDHRGHGPVHINVPMKYYSTTFPLKSLPEVKKIDRMFLGDDEAVWAGKARELAAARRILVVCGQEPGCSPELDRSLEAFCEAYGCVVAAEHMSNVHVSHSFNPSVCMDTRYVSDKVFEELMPDVVVSFGGNVMAGVKAMLCRNAGLFQHWLVQEDGVICDMFKSIKNVFECKPEHFFSFMAKAAGASAVDTSYRETVLSYAASVEYPEVPWSNIYAIKGLVDRLKPGSILHTSINSAIRVTNFYDLPEGVDYYANIGTHGIDGCLSSFLGQAVASPERPAYLVIGDLAFFYDMNALRIRHLGPNVKILLINNHGGEEFYYNGMWQNDASDLHTTARHGNVAEGWVRSVGIEYFSAHGKEEYDRAIEEFCSVEGRPALIEVFTEMRDDRTFAEILRLEPSAYYLMVGDGDMRPQVEELVRELGLEDRVIMPGYLPDPAPVYSALDCFLMPSLFEGLAIVCSEALPPEAHVTDAEVLMPLSAGERAWAKKAVEMARMEGDRAAYAELVRGGFDADDTAALVSRYLTVGNCDD